MTLLEPDVTLTDYGLFVECTVLASLVWRNDAPAQPLRFWFTVFFCAIGLAALLGGSAHGFFADETSLLRQLLWTGTLLTIGLAAWSGWAAGARLLLSASAAERLTRAAGVVYIVYALVVVFIERRFMIAIVHYLPAAIFLLIAFVQVYRRRRAPAALAGAIGLALTFIAAAIQMARIGLHPHYFNHNALYHLIQAIALVFIYFAARHLVRVRAR